MTRLALLPALLTACSAASTVQPPGDGGTTDPVADASSDRPVSVEGGTDGSGATPTTISQKHVLQFTDNVHWPGNLSWGTAAMTSYLDKIAPYVDWFLYYGTPTPTVASDIHAATPAFKVMWYTYPTAAAQGEPTYDYYVAQDPNDESLFSHTCGATTAATRNYVKNGSVFDSVFDVSSPKVRSLWSTFSDQGTKAGFDAIFWDEAAVLWASGIPSPYANTTNCTGTVESWGCFSYENRPCDNATHTGYDRQQYLADTLGCMKGAGVPVFYNSANDFYEADPVTKLPDSVEYFDKDPAILGGRMEDCYWDRFASGGSRPSLGTTWTGQSNVALLMARDKKLFGCMPVDDFWLGTSPLVPIYADSDEGRAVRTYITASFLMTYDPATSAFWSWIDPSSKPTTGTYSPTDSRIPIMPEQDLVALSPLVPTPTDVSSLQASTGAYGREYAACYLSGKLVGACAVAVNIASTGTVPFPFAGYTSTLVMHGGGVFDGGSVTTDGPAPAALPSATATIAFKM